MHRDWTENQQTIKGKSLKAIFHADNEHVHHKLVKRGFSQKQAVLILYGASAILGMFAVILLESGILIKKAVLLAGMKAGFLMKTTQFRFLQKKMKMLIVLCLYLKIEKLVKY